MALRCRDFVELLMAWLDGELEPERDAALRAHVAACPPCERYLESYRRTVALGREACEPDGPLPEDVPEELVRALLAARSRR